MHEMSLMQSIFDIANEQLAGIPVQRVLRVKLKVGQLANALADSLQFAFEAFSRDTVYEGAELEIEEVPATWRCNQCSSEFTADVGMVTCPQCHNSTVELIKGRDLLLDSLEVE